MRKHLPLPSSGNHVNTSKATIEENMRGKWCVQLRCLRQTVCGKHVFFNWTQGWIYHFQPYSKAKNKVWVSSEGDRPVIVCRCKTFMRYSLIRKVQSFKFQSQEVVLSLESFTEKVFLLNLLISIRNADRAPVSTASNYSMITRLPINPLRYRNIWKNLGSMS